MDRRAFLGAVAGAGLLAGCTTGGGRNGGDPIRSTVEPADVPEAGAAGAGGAGAADTDAAGGTPTTTVDRIPVASLGNPGTICSEATQRDPGIYAITDPVFDSDWSGYDVAEYVPPDSDPLEPEWTVIGLEREGRARAYPLEILWFHEVVNDAFGGPVMVTYCPICRSGLVAGRVVDGRTTTFAVTGLLWAAPREFSAAREVEGEVFGADREGGAADVRHSGNVVLYDDATHSYWSQILARAICGPATGTDLAVEPSTVTTWGAWREAHPDTEVLLPPPYSGVRETNPPIRPADE